MVGMLFNNILYCFSDIYIRFVVAAICVSKHVAAFVVYILNTKNLLLFFVLFQVILYLLAAIILKCIII